MIFSVESQSSYSHYSHYISIRHLLTDGYSIDDYWVSERRSVPNSPKLGYTDIENEIIYISGYFGESRVVNIPSEINKKPVVVIWEHSFFESQLEEINIPDSTGFIGESAFSNNFLTSLNIPDSVINIGVWAFQSNLLENVTLSDNILSIGGGAFSYNNIKTINIPDKITEINNATFYNNNLTSITIPNSIKIINTKAFLGNIIKQITIGDNVLIAGDAFEFEFADFYIANDSKAGTYIFNNGKWNIEKEEASDINVETIEKKIICYEDGITIPDYVNSIHNKALSNIIIKKITIGANVVIPKDAFALDFSFYYNRTGMRAGTYLYTSHKGWQYNEPKYELTPEQIEEVLQKLLEN